MNYLLDTHAFLWSVFAPEKLSRKARTVIADTGHAIHLSTVTFWEISLKFALGKLRLDGCTPESLVGVAREMGLTLIAPDANETASAHQLPRIPHSDPVDRLLVWQAIQRQHVLITKEGALPAYTAAGLKVLW